jgi:hypothetical protein
VNLAGEAFVKTDSMEILTIALFGVIVLFFAIFNNKNRI